MITFPFTLWNSQKHSGSCLRREKKTHQCINAEWAMHATSQSMHPFSIDNARVWTAMSLSVSKPTIIPHFSYTWESPKILYIAGEHELSEQESNPFHPPFGYLFTEYGSETARHESSTSIYIYDHTYLHLQGGLRGCGKAYYTPYPDINNTMHYSEGKTSHLELLQWYNMASVILTTRPTFLHTTTTTEEAPETDKPQTEDGNHDIPKGPNFFFSVSLYRLPCVFCIQSKYGNAAVTSTRWETVSCWQWYL